MQKRIFDRLGKTKLGEIFLSLIQNGLLFLAFSLLFALVAYRLKNPVFYLPVFSFAAFILSGLVGGFLTAKRKKDGKFVSALLFGSFAAAFAVLLTLALGSHIGGNTVLSTVCYVASGALGGILGCLQKKHRIRR